MQIFSRLLLITVVSCLHTFSTYSVMSVEIQTNQGSDVDFVLPAVETCGRYNLTDPQNRHVLTVYNMSHVITNSVYIGRSTSQLLANGTLLFKLQFIQNSDNGTFLVIPGRRSPDQCWQKYVLTVNKPSSSTGYWLSWQAWSQCNKACGDDSRSRIRECSIPNYCKEGDSYETSPCSKNPACYAWTNWSDWNECSVTCADGSKSRHRYCYAYNQTRASDDNCLGDSYEWQRCSMPACPVSQPSTYQWTEWGPWCNCSQSCGTGFQSRFRKCHIGNTLAYPDRCFGQSTDNRTCEAKICEEEVGDTGNDVVLNTRDQTVQLPLSVIVGTGAGIFILVLTIVVCVLVIKLRRKREILGIVKTGSIKRSHSVTKKAYISKKSSVVSCSSLGVSGVHVYDEINSDDLKSQRMSVLTIDNPYVALPKTPSPGYANTESVTYSNTGNTEGTVFMFETSVPGQGQRHGHGQGRKVSAAYQNSSNSLSVPRHMSVDSVGYLMPGHPAERAARRNVKYTKKNKTAAK